MEEGNYALDINGVWWVRPVGFYMVSIPMHKVTTDKAGKASAVPGINIKQDHKGVMKRWTGRLSNGELIESKQ